MPRYRLQVSARLLSWPQRCACCGGHADTRLRAAASKSKGTRVVTTSTRWWEVPHCSQCVAHIEHAQSANTCNVVGVVVGLITASIVYFKFGAGWAALGIGGVIFCGFIFWSNTLRAKAKELTKPKCASTDIAVQYVGWYGSMHEFNFSSEEYIHAFIAANGRKTMSDIRMV